MQDPEAGLGPRRSKNRPKLGCWEPNFDSCRLCVVFPVKKAMDRLALLTFTAVAVGAPCLAFSSSSAKATPRPRRMPVRDGSGASTETETILGAATATETSAEAQEGLRNDFDGVVMKTYGRYPITMVKGEGVELWDSTGKKYLDFVAGISTCCLGHAHKGLVKAVEKQIKSVHHVSNLYYIPQQGELAKWLVSKSPADRVFFCNSGAEANEAAIKLARKHAHTKLGLDEPVIITAESSFHGRTLAAITATGQPKYQANFDFGGSMVEGFEYIPYNDIEALRATVAKVQGHGKGLKGILGKLKFWKKSKKRGVAAIMLEALQGEGGIRPGDAEFFAAARELCDETGALLMCDEVQVGMGRSGEMWGFQKLGVTPDVFTVAKALGAGVPIGAMLCKENANVFAPGDHASTFGGNPLACAAGMAVAEAIDGENILENVESRGEQLRAGLRALQEDPAMGGLIKDVRGWGLIVGVELNVATGVTAGELVGSAIDEGLLLVPAGTHVVRFVPPLIVTKADVEEALKIFAAACKRQLA